MYHVIFEEADKYEVAVLIKKKALDRDAMMKYYVTPSGVSPDKMIGFSLFYDSKDKAKAAEKTEYLNGLLKSLDSLGVTTLLIADSDYFKFMTKKKVTGSLGYVMPCALKGYEHMSCILSVNHKVLYFNPDRVSEIELANQTMTDHVNGSFEEIGAGIIHSEHYPSELSDIKATLNKLHDYPVLDCDIEAFSLKFWKAGIATIAFSWDKHNGVAFPVDYVEISDNEIANAKIMGSDEYDGVYGKCVHNPEIKALLKQFFIEYKGKLVYHNANYDVKVLIYELFMDDLLDQKGLLHGLEVLTRDIDDTKIITYLAVNSTAGNKLTLKHNAHEYAGNYAQEEINDVRRIPLPKLLKYNLTDCLCTRYVNEKNYPIMVQDEQLNIYNTIMIPSVKSILQIELTGMCLDMPRVLEVKSELEAIRNMHRKALFESDIIKKFIVTMEDELFITTNAGWKKKSEPREFFTGKFEFNPNSDPQLQKLIFNFLGYPVMDKTKGGAPATGGDVIKKILANAKSDEDKEMLVALEGLAGVGIILDTFINAFLENSVLKADGMYYLHGSFNIGGTVSGRLSSSKP